MGAKKEAQGPQIEPQVLQSLVNRNANGNGVQLDPNHQEEDTDLLQDGDSILLDSTSLIERRVHSVREWRDDNDNNRNSTILSDLRITQPTDEQDDDDDDTLLVLTPPAQDKDNFTNSYQQDPAGPILRNDNFNSNSYQQDTSGGNNNNIKYLELQGGVLTGVSNHSKTSATDASNSGGNDFPSANTEAAAAV